MRRRRAFKETLKTRVGTYSSVKGLISMGLTFEQFQLGSNMKRKRRMGTLQSVHL